MSTPAPEEGLNQGTKRPNNDESKDGNVGKKAKKNEETEAENKESSGIFDGILVYVSGKRDNRKVETVEALEMEGAVIAKTITKATTHVLLSDKEADLGISMAKAKHCEIIDHEYVVKKLTEHGLKVPELLLIPPEKKEKKEEVTPEKDRAFRPRGSGRYSLDREPMKYIVEVVTGDNKGASHGLTQDFLIRSTLTSDEIKAAYQAGEKELGVEFSSKVAIEKNELPVSVYTKLVKAGIEMKDIELDDSVEGELHLDPSSFRKIWLAIAKLGSPKFEYEEVYKQGSVHTGGNGCFQKKDKKV